MPRMFFGDEYLGKAVAFLRHSKDLKQHQLAARIGVKPGTMNQYESGRRGMSEDVVARIAVALEIRELQIWDTAYRIFRYNGLREWAEREGTTVEELLARSGSRPSVEQILETYDSRTAHDRRFVDLICRFLESLGRNGVDGANLLEVVVQTRPPRGSRDTRKAVRLTRKRGKATS